MIEAAYISEDKFFFLLQIKKVSVVSEETKKELDRMIVENQELKSVLSKTRSDANVKVCIKKADTVK